MQLATVDRPRLKPLARLLLIALGGLPLAAPADDGDAARAIPMQPASVRYVVAQAETAGAPREAAAAPSEPAVQASAVPEPAPMPVAVSAPAPVAASALAPVAASVPDPAPLLAAAAQLSAPPTAPAPAGGTPATAAGDAPLLLAAAIAPAPGSAPVQEPAPRAPAATLVAAQEIAAPPAAPAAQPPGPADTATIAAATTPPEPSISAGPERAPGEPLALKTEPALTSPRTTEKDVPVFVQGVKISGQNGGTTVIEGDAELRKRGELIKADTITYFPVEDEMYAQRNVRVLQQGNLFTGDELRLKLDAHTGYFLDVNYLLADEKARGEALRLDFLGQDAYHGEDATYTTCGPGNDDWYLKVGKLNLDFGRDLGEAENAKLVFKGHEILELPSMSFPLNDKRKSGFLAPSFGTSIQSGTEVTIPYYWNIAPNRDITFNERYMTKRGLQSSASMRYMGEGYRGQLSGEILPHDNLTRTTRSGFSLLHDQYFGQFLGGGWTGYLNLNKVSDNTYFTDLAARLALTAQTYLPREGRMIYNNVPDGYTLTFYAQSFQTLQDPLAPVAVPYFRLPEVTLAANRYDIKGFDFGLTADYTRFSSATQVMGSRSYVLPSVSYPIVTPGFYITPTASLSSTRYNLQNLDAWQTGVALPPNASNTITRNLPIYSVDSGMTFERQASYFGRDYTQTLEPRLYYLRIPYRDQSNIPIFDTGLADFNFSQIFSNNVYSGYDRIADANQLTAAISTRLLSSTNGAERLRMSIGQRIYFASQLVTLPSETTRVTKVSDFLAAISGDLVPGTRFDSAVEYSPTQKQIQRVSHAVRYSPQPGNTVLAAYRYQRDLLEEVDFAGQWQITPRWYAVGRYNYSLRDGRVAETLGGLEYNGDCWVGRFVVQRFAVATGKASTSMFFQIELNGLSALGSNPLEVLRRNIPGYTKLNANQTRQPNLLSNYE